MRLEVAMQLTVAGSNFWRIKSSVLKESLGKPWSQNILRYTYQVSFITYPVRRLSKPIFLLWHLVIPTDQKMTGWEYCVEKEKGNAVLAQDKLSHCGRNSQKHCWWWQIKGIHQVPKILKNSALLQPACFLHCWNSCFPSWQPTTAMGTE